MTSDTESEALAWETAMLAQIDRLKAALKTARADALEEAATLCDRREDTWGTATIRWEANALAKQIRALKETA